MEGFIEGATPAADFHLEFRRLLLARRAGIEHYDGAAEDLGDLLGAGRAR